MRLDKIIAVTSCTSLTISLPQRKSTSLNIGQCLHACEPYGISSQAGNYRERFGETPSSVQDSSPQCFQPHSNHISLHDCSRTTVLLLTQGRSKPIETQEPSTRSAQGAKNVSSLTSSFSSFRAFSHHPSSPIFVPLSFRSPAHTSTQNPQLISSNLDYTPSRDQLASSSTLTLASYVPCQHLVRVFVPSLFSAQAPTPLDADASRYRLLPTMHRALASLHCYHRLLPATYPLDLIDYGDKPTDFRAVI